MKTESILLGALLLASLSAAAGETNAVSFGIFMPREDVYHATLDVTERINAYYRSDPAKIPLAQYPILADEEIVSYHWPTHTLALKRPIWWRLRQPGVHGAPFVLVVDGAPVYVGAFYTSLSSISCPVPVVMFDRLMKTNSIQIQAAYPSEQFAKGKDPRADERIKAALIKMGKLRL